ncbi:MAG: DUF1415 domain-containing protein [Pseudomonadota bacterium]
MQCSDEDVIFHTRRWVSDVIVAMDICPFARRELARDSIRVAVSRVKKLALALEELMKEVQWLDEHPPTETTLLVFPTLFKDFEHYLDFIELAESLLAAQGYEGTYQLASFHPDYCFADADPDDASNYTNRSPYPMVHLLREASLTQAIEYYGDTQQIPENNIAKMNEIGAAEAQRRLAACFDNLP